MTAAIALVSFLALTPAQAPGVSVTNVRLTYRDWGATRPDAKFLPGDVFFLSFDIEGLKANDTGEVTYSMGMELLDKIGKAINTFPTSKSTVTLPLGGGKLPGNVFVGIEQDRPPGIYTCKVSVADATAPTNTRIIEQKFEVLPKDFGLVAAYVSRDDKGDFPCGMSGIAGQTVYVQVALVGLGRGADKKPDSAIEFRVLNSKGEPTTKKPIVAAVPKDWSESLPVVPFDIPLPLNHEGSFTIEIKAKDNVTNKTASLKFPFTVYPASK
jgi:hypothetical protein